MIAGVNLQCPRRHGNTAAREHGGTGARRHGDTAARGTGTRRHGNTAARGTGHGDTAAREHGGTGSPDIEAFVRVNDGTSGEGRGWVRLPGPRVRRRSGRHSKPSHLACRARSGLVRQIRGLRAAPTCAELGNRHWGGRRSGVVVALICACATRTSSCCFHTSSATAPTPVWAPGSNKPWPKPPVRSTSTRLRLGEPPEPPWATRWTALPTGNQPVRRTPAAAG